MLLLHGRLLRCTVEDLDGRRVGRVVGTLPDEADRDPDLVLVALGGTFGRRRWITLEGATWSPGRLRLPIRREAIEEAPSPEDNGFGNPADVARAFWVAALG